MGNVGGYRRYEFTKTGRLDSKSGSRVGGHALVCLV